MGINLMATRLLQVFLLLLVGFYRRTLSYFMGGQCRFSPSCSVFAEQALRLHGPFWGTRLTLRRIFRCHPWHEGDCVDPVPQAPRVRQPSSSPTLSDCA